MAKLEKDWITDGLIDFEYKKYVLLAYLKQVRGNFDETKLYPFLSDLIEHYSHALSFQKEKTLLQSGFPKELSEIDLEQLKFSYQELTQDSELMAQLEKIVEYALPKMKDTLGLGKERYEEIESHLAIEPIGIVPLYKNEGYLMMELGNNSLTNIYQYKVSNFVMSGEGFRGVYLKLIETIKRGIGDTLEGLKLKLIRTYQSLPNPATYLVQSEYPYPMKETVIPITKRLVLQTIAQH